MNTMKKCDKLSLGGLLILSLCMLFFIIVLLVVTFADISFFDVKVLGVGIKGGEITFQQMFDTDFDASFRNYGFYNYETVRLCLGLAMFFAFTMIVPVIESIFIRMNNNWKNQIGRFAAGSIIWTVICIVVFSVLISFARIFKIKITSGYYDELDNQIYTYKMGLGSGAVLVIVSLALFAFALIVYNVLVLLYSKGVISEKVFNSGIEKFAENKRDDNDQCQIETQEPYSKPAETVQPQPESAININNDISVLRRKLVELNALKEEGLINEEDYQTKKSELLKKYD